MIVLSLGWLTAVRAATPDEETEALRALGTLLTVVTGVFSAVWWHQSVDLSEAGEADPKRMKVAALLNRAAATTTGLALIGNVFSTFAWTTAEGKLAAAAFLLILALSGNEIHSAARVSFAHARTPRSILAFVILTVAAVLFAVRWLGL